MPKTKYCVICKAPLTNEFKICPVCNKTDPFSKSYQFQYRDPLSEMINGVRTKVEEIKRKKAEMNRQKNMRYMRMMQNMMNSMDNIQQLGENIGESLSDGVLDFGEMMNIASEAVGIYSNITGKGQNLALALEGISGISDGFGGVFEDGFDLFDLSNFMEGGTKAIAGITGNAELLEKAESARDGYIQAQLGFQTGNLDAAQKGMDQFLEATTFEGTESGALKPKALGGNVSEEIINSIEGLKRLCDTGAITEVEFEAKKRKLLEKL